MPGTETLSNTDFLRWTEEQAAALGCAKGANLPLDRENLAEKIESLGNRSAAHRSQLSRTPPPSVRA